MSARRAPIHLEPAVGLAVLIADETDCQHGQIGWITHLEGAIARVDFGDDTSHIPRWFQLSELRDARIAATEPLMRLASGCAAARIRCQLSFDGLDFMESLTWLRAPQN